MWGLEQSAATRVLSLEGTFSAREGDPVFRLGRGATVTTLRLTLKIPDSRSSILVAFAVSALVLPLAAQAGSWPAGKKAEYVQQCKQIAVVQGVDAKKADLRCKCGADTIEKNFTTGEIEALGGKEMVDSKLLQRALTVVQKVCAQKGE